MQNANYLLILFLGTNPTEISVQTTGHRYMFNTRCLTQMAKLKTLSAHKEENKSIMK